MKFAKNTAVAVSKSRAEIDSLLRQWGCDGIQWTDDFRQGVVQLRFIWKHDEVQYRARIEVALENDETTRQIAVDGRNGKFSPTLYAKLSAEKGKREHRVLLLWLKAALNAVDDGIVAAEAIFLPFLEDKSGRTVAQVVGAQMHELLKGSAIKLLGPAK